MTQLPASVFTSPSLPSVHSFSSPVCLKSPLAFPLKGRLSLGSGATYVIDLDCFGPLSTDRKYVLSQNYRVVLLFPVYFQLVQLDLKLTFSYSTLLKSLPSRKDIQCLAPDDITQGTGPHWTCGLSQETVCFPKYGLRGTDNSHPEGHRHQFSLYNLHAESSLFSFSTVTTP